MSEGQTPTHEPEIKETEVKTGSKAGNKPKSKNPDEKKGKKEEKVIYMTVEEEDDPTYVKIKRLILKLIDQYVMTYKKPIRRKKLKELVFTNDEKLMKIYEEEKEVAVGMFTYALVMLTRDGKVLKVKDPEKKRHTYYILPKHLKVLGINTEPEVGQGKSNG
jgi:hypothetical protein